MKLFVSPGGTVSEELTEFIELGGYPVEIMTLEDYGHLLEDIGMLPDVDELPFLILDDESFIGNPDMMREIIYEEFN